MEYFFLKSAVKEVRKLPREIQKKLFDELDYLSQFSHPLQYREVLKLKGNYDLPTYRLRVGRNYRAIFRVINQNIVISRVFHRQEGY